MNLFKRFIWNNFLRGSRLPLYESFMKRLVENEYTFITIEKFNHLLRHSDTQTLRHSDTQTLRLSKEKYAIIRHDIDTDPKTAYNLFKIEKKYSIQSTYYFRLKTIDKKIIREIQALDCEVGYHYEELATYAKQNKLHTKSEIDAHLGEIQKYFLDHLSFFRNSLNVKSPTVASHGDWYNAHYLKIQNCYLIDDGVRKAANIELEAYDKSFMDHVTCRIADLGSIDGIWTPVGLNDAINRDEKVLYILIHPRQWYSRIYSNVSEDFCRILETIKFKL